MSRFTEWLIRENSRTLTNFKEWVFYPGMLFGASDTWWGRGKKRPGPHEGLDMGFYRDSEGGIHHWGFGVNIPLMHDGEVMKISQDDFIGASIYVVHPQFLNPAGDLLYSVYAHAAPMENIREGDHLKASTIIAHVADFTKTKAAMIDHLHLSLAYLSRSFLKENMTWKIMADPAMVTLLNPLDHIGGQYGMRAYPDDETKKGVWS